MITIDPVNSSKKYEKQMKMIGKDNDTNGNDTSSAQFHLLSQNIISPFRNLILILLYSNFIPFNIREYNENIVIEKFTIINDFIKDVIIKLIDVFPKRSKRQIYIDEISVIHGLEYEMLPSSIEENINFFTRYNLKERVEDLWESLWKIISPFLRLFNFYVQIGGQMKRNDVNSVRKLLDIKQQYAYIEKGYKSSK